MTSPGPITQRTTGSQNVQIDQVQNSTIMVSFDSRPHRPVPLEPAWIELPPDVTSPARLLRARYGVVPYLPPADLGERLASWCHSPAPFALRVVAGAAGAGKTRIAIELCRTLSGLGWLTGLLKGHVDPGALDVLADTADRAAGRGGLRGIAPGAARRGAAHPGQAGDRGAPGAGLADDQERGNWRGPVRRALYGHGDALDVVIDDAAVDLLADLPFGEVERTGLFAKAVDAFSSRLGRDPEAGRRLLPELPDQGLVNALMVLVAAYLAVADGRVPIDRTELLDGLLAHEDRYWFQAANAAGLSLGERLRRRVVALATLAGAGASGSEMAAETAAASLLRLVPDLAEASEERRRDHAQPGLVHRLYPGTAWWNPSSRTWLASTWWRPRTATRPGCRPACSRTGHRMPWSNPRGCWRGRPAITPSWLRA